MAQKKTAYLFDIDGVLTDPVKKHVTEEGLFDQLIDRLATGPVGINTGRSTAWIWEKLIEPMQNKMEDKSLLANLFVVGEKGGTWMRFEKDGTMKHGKTEGFFVSSSIEQAVRKVLEKDYQEAFFFDETKETMLSLEMHKGFDLSEFHKQQKTLTPKLEEILMQTHTDKEYVIDPSVIATDIQKKEAGKGIGATRFLQFLEENNLQADRFITFGDSKPDIEMADELVSQHKDVEFVFVGKKELLGDLTRDYPIIVADGYSRATLAYLEQEKADSHS